MTTTHADLLDHAPETGHLSIHDDDVTSMGAPFFAKIAGAVVIAAAILPAPF